MRRGLRPGDRVEYAAAVADQYRQQVARLRARVAELEAEVDEPTMRREAAVLRWAADRLLTGPATDGLLAAALRRWADEMDRPAEHPESAGAELAVLDTDSTVATLADHLPAGTTTTLSPRWSAREVAEFQAEHLSQAGYGLVATS